MSDEELVGFANEHKKSYNTLYPSEFAAQERLREKYKTVHPDWSNEQIGKFIKNLRYS